MFTLKNTSNGIQQSEEPGPLTRNNNYGLVMIMLCGLEHINNQVLANFHFDLCIQTIRVVPIFVISIIFFTLLTATDSTGIAMIVIVH